MAKCKTCGTTIRVPKGWSIGPAVRRHYWAKHPERMDRTRADKAAEASIPARRGRRRAGSDLG